MHCRSPPFNLPLPLWLLHPTKMLLPVTFAATMLGIANAASPGLSLPAGAHGVGIAVGGMTWFNPGNVTVTVRSMTFSTADGSLKLL